MAHQTDGTCPCDARKYGVTGFGNHHHPVDDEGHIHGAAFLDTLMGLSIGPQYLVIAFRLGQFCGIQRASIVASCFGSSCAPMCSSSEVLLHLDLDRLGIIGPNRTSENAKAVRHAGPNTDMAFCGKHERANVQGTVWGVRHPVFVQLHHFHQGLKENIFWHRRHAHPTCRKIQSLDVGPRAKEGNAAIFLTKCLHSFKNGLAVVQGHHCWRKGHGAKS